MITKTPENEVDQNINSVYQLLEEIFESSVLEADLTDSIDNLTQLYESFTGQGFESGFEDILMLSVGEPRRNKDVHKLFRFISDFAVSLDNKYKSENSKNSKSNKDENEDLVHPFLKYLFKTLECWSTAASYIIRFRSCQLLNMILSNVLDIGVGEIDVDVYEKISNLIQARRKDVSANVRAHAVLLAKFFQDPSDHKDPVIAGLCWQLQTDPNPRVRQNILEILAACEETIIPVTRRFLHDKNALVRNSALLHICHRISPRSYLAQNRVLILNHCFTDSSPIVRRNAEQKLIPMWFRAYGDKLCPFLKSLRLGKDCLDKLPFTTELIHLLFKLVKISQILEEIDLDTETALPKSLNGEKIFIWRHFYAMAYQQEKLQKFIPQPESLIEFITKCFKESTFEDNDAYTYNELISFTMDAVDIIGNEKCEALPALAIDIIKNLFTPKEVVPYAVAFYCEYATKETKEIHNDLLQVVNDLLKFVDIATGEEQKKLILKCLDIFSETLAQDNISGCVELIAVKDDLVLSNFHSDDEDIKTNVFRALSLYCLLDLEEAKQFWPLIEKAVYEASDDASKTSILKGAFDILKCHGCKLFDHSDDEDNNQFDDVLNNILTHLEDEEIDMNFILKGMFKLFLSHQTFSPVILGRLILLMFHPDDGYTTKTTITNFLQLYGESKEEADCLTRSFLITINILFNSPKTYPYYKTSIKTVSSQFLEFAKIYEENKNFNLEVKFKDLLALKLTKKILKKPWRLPALDLQDILEHIVPKNIDTLIKLKANVKLIAESLHSAVFQQKNPFSKKSIKFFTGYMKKIQAAIDGMPNEEPAHSQRLNSSPGNSFLANGPIEQVSPQLQNEHAHSQRLDSSPGNGFLAKGPIEQVSPPSQYEEISF